MTRRLAPETRALRLAAQIQAITGHTTTAMVRRYAGAARQKTRAKEAQERRK